MAAPLAFRMGALAQTLASRWQKPSQEGPKGPIALRTPVFDRVFTRVCATGTIPQAREDGA